jgi:hypothetical protein
MAIIGTSILWGYAYVVYLALTNLETYGGSVQVYFWEEQLYEWWGKWGVILFYVGLGLLIFLGGIAHLKAAWTRKRL